MPYPFRERPVLGVRHLVAAVLAVIPFVPYAYLHAPAGSGVVRYGVEFAVDVAAVVAVVLRGRLIFARLRPLLIAVAALILFWLFTDLWNAVSPRTAVVAMRADLRFLPIAVVVAAAVAPLRDSRLYLWTILVGASVQSVLAVLAAAHATTLQTTLANRNELGIFLMLAGIALAASYEELGRRATIVFAVLLALGIVATASREGGIGLIVGLLLVVFVRARPRARWAVAAAAIVIGLLLLTPTLVGTGTGALDANGVTSRWTKLFNASYSPNGNFRTRLLTDNAKLVWRTEPVFGVGFGTASAPSVIADLTSPVYRSFKGFDLVPMVEPYVYDSNWAIIVLETGIVGVAAVAALLAYLVLIGFRASQFWVGRALVGTTAAIALTCFAAPVLREPVASLVLWLLAALSLIAVRSEGSPRRG
jgi:hypothetical protein